MVHLRESGGSLRQNALAAALGWDRTRLSHLLTRMADRYYLIRSRVPNGMEIALRPEGRRMIDATLPVLEAATCRHLLDRLGQNDARALKALVNRLLPGEERDLDQDGRAVARVLRWFEATVAR